MAARDAELAASSSTTSHYKKITTYCDMAGTCSCAVQAFCVNNDHCGFPLTSGGSSNACGVAKAFNSITTCLKGCGTYCAGQTGCVADSCQAGCP